MLDQYPSWSHVRQMCNKCHFVFDASISLFDATTCPNCGDWGDTSQFPDGDRVELFDMIEYFNQRGTSLDDEMIKELSSTLQKDLGITIVRAQLAKIEGVVQDFYDKVVSDMRWIGYFHEEVVRIIQDQLTLPTYEQADKVWSIVGHYSAMTRDHKMVIVLVNMLLEHLLDGRLIVLATTHDGYDQAGAGDLVYEKLRTLPMKRRYFVQHLPHMSVVGKLSNDQVDAEFYTALGRCAPSDFCSDWDALRRVRNRFIHENVWMIEMADVQRALRLARQAIPVFAEIQNRYCLKDRTSA